MRQQLCMLNYFSCSITTCDHIDITLKIMEHYLFLFSMVFLPRAMRCEILSRLIVVKGGKRTRQGQFHPRSIVAPFSLTHLHGHYNFFGVWPAQCGLIFTTANYCALSSSRHVNVVHNSFTVTSHVIFLVTDYSMKYLQCCIANLDGLICVCLFLDKNCCRSLPSSRHVRCSPEQLHSYCLHDFFVVIDSSMNCL